MEGIDSEYPGISPHPHPAPLYILFLCAADPALAREMWLAVLEQWRWKMQRSTGLDPSLPAFGNWHPATSHGQGLASQHNTLQHLFFFAGVWEGLERWGGRQSGFYRTPELTGEYTNSADHR